VSVELNVIHLILMWAGLSLVAWAIKALAGMLVSSGGPAEPLGKAVLNVSI
jgi:hypothetical protein